MSAPDAGFAPAPIPEDRLFRRGETVAVKFDLDTHEVVSVTSAPANELYPLDGWPGWE